MQVDRSHFLLLAAALAACHGRHDGSAPGPARPTPSPATGSRDGLPVVPVPAPAPVGPASSSSNPEAPGADGAGPVAASDPLADSRVEESAARCAALSRQGEACGEPDEDRLGEMCRRIATEFQAPVAHDAIDCLAARAASCDGCAVSQCTLGPLERAWQSRPAGSTGPAAECEPVRRRAVQVLGDGEPYHQLCAHYAYGMTPVGRRRFIRCMTEHVGIGVRFCLWDPSVTPCTESRGRVPPYGLF